jgi:RND family efflux transporter MFP subunit
LKKALVIFVVLIVGGLFAWLVYQRAAGAPEKSPPNSGVYAVAVEVVPVKRATIRDVAQLTGSLVPDSHFVVAPKVGGRLEKLFVNIGDAVERGQVIALLDDEEYKQQVEQARAEREVAKANVLESQSNLNAAEREYERVKSLRKKQIVSESELDTSKAHYEAQEAQYKVAQAQVAQREAALKAAGVRLSYTKIRVSWENGDNRRLVGERFVDEGAMLKANDPIVSVLDIHPLTAVIYVIERDYSKIKIGQTTLATTDAFPGQTFKGTVLRVAPLLRETSREARVEIEMPNPKEILKPGMFVRVEIEFGRHEDTTVVPLSSLVRRGGKRGVFVADQEKRKARFVPVEVGIVNGDLAEVVSPALAGSVVTLGHHLLQDGSSILLPDTELDSSASQGVVLRGPSNHTSTKSKSAS